MKPCDHSNVRIRRLFPGIPEHLHCAESAVLAQLLVCFVGVDDVVEGKGYAHDVSKPFRLHVHRACETRIEGSHDPGRPVERPTVHARQRLGGSKPKDGVEMTQ